MQNQRPSAPDQSFAEHGAGLELGKRWGSTRGGVGTTGEGSLNKSIVSMKEEETPILSMTNVLRGCRLKWKGYCCFL